MVEQLSPSAPAVQAVVVGAMVVLSVVLAEAAVVESAETHISVTSSHRYSQ